MIPVGRFDPIVKGETRLVLEAGPCNGSVAYARKAVRVAAAAGVWGFKVQLYKRERLVTQTAPTYGKGIVQAATQWEDFEHTLDYDEWGEIKETADGLGLVFFASVFDMEAVEWCETVGTPIYKIASADITYRQLIQRVAATGKPIVLSTGGATPEEIFRAFQWIDDVGRSPVLPLLCTLSYPCPLDAARLRRIDTWHNAVGGMVGYSDHTESICTPLVAGRLGAVLVEKHFTITPGRGGDHDFAVTPVGAAQIVEQMGRTPNCGLGEGIVLASGDSSIQPYPEERVAIRNARRSCVTTRPLTAGHRLGVADVTFLRPGTGVPPFDVQRLLGQTLKTDVPAGKPLEHSDFQAT